MKLLVLGGTKFVGRHLVYAALEAGHEVTLFNRGITDSTLFPEITQIRGDRDGGLEPLRGHDWDAVIDCCGYVPRVVKQSADFFATTAALYVYISTISVYAPRSGTSRVDERTPVASLKDAQTEEITGATYGPLKAACELIIRDAFPTRALFIRPGIIAGPYDPTDRFSYWVHRASIGGKILAPGDGTQPVQIIDARDLAQWVISLVEHQTTGFYNAVGPAVPVTIKRMLQECVNATRSGAKLEWVGNDELAHLGLSPDSLPLYVANRDDWSFFSVDPARAISAGLTLRPIASTIKDTLAWLNQIPNGFQPKIGLDRELEANLLAARSHQFPV